MTARHLTADEAVAKVEEVLGLTEADWHALRKATRDTIRSACLTKVPMGLNAAKGLERQMRAEGHKITAYRCPFSPPDHHRHVGHVPSIESIVALQAAVRDLHGNLPTN